MAEYILMFVLGGVFGFILYSTIYHSKVIRLKILSDWMEAMIAEQRTVLKLLEAANKRFTVNKEV